jgi:hypothetical protein
MKILFAGQVPKEPSFPDANEGAFEKDPESGKIAVSDGASESFDSKTWARLLACRFVENPQLNERWLADAIADYTARADYASLSWSKQAAFSEEVLQLCWG